MTKAVRKQQKSLDDWQIDMSVLYDEVKDDTTQLKHASELANICGKALKAEQLKLAREIFTSQLGRKIDAPTAENVKALTHAA